MSVTAPARTDVIDQILGVEEGSRIAEIRARHPQLAAQDQSYYQSLFDPNEAAAAAFPLADRLLIAVRVASHTGSEPVVAWYAGQAADLGVAAAPISRARDVATPWTDATPLGAAVRHADLLTTQPSAARASHLQALKDAGYSPAGILSLSQVVAFVSYQLRLIAGLRALGASS
jgi:CMD domain protein